LRHGHGELLSDAALAGFGIALHSTWHVSADLRAFVDFLAGRFGDNPPWEQPDGG
jgi:hypothetical protein